MDTNGSNVKQANQAPASKNKASATNALDSNENASKAPEQAEQNTETTQPFTETLFFRRFVATTADLMIVSLLCFISFFLVNFFFAGFNTKFFQVTMFVNALVWLVGAFAILLRDGPHSVAAFDYRSPGKFFLHLRATDLKKEPLTYKMSIERNFVVASGIFCIALTSMVSAVSLPIITMILQIIMFVLSFICFLLLVKETWALYKSKDNRRPGDIKASTMVEYY